MSILFECFNCFMLEFHPDALHLFQTMVSHSNLTAFLLSQNLYPPGVYAKSILLNCQHVILFKNVRDNRQIITFGSQVFTGRSKFWMDAYAKLSREATLRIYSGGFDSSLSRRLRTNLLPEEGDTIVYRL